MSYFDGFVAAVPEARKEEYVAHAKQAWERIFAPAGAVRVLEAWGDDVPEGEVTSFPMAVKREAGEAVVLSFIEWPDRAARDACYARMQAGDMPEGMSDMPFDGRRMIYGGFTPVLVAAAEEMAPA